MPDKQLRLRVKAREYGEQQLEALGFASRMEFELDDGSVVELVHPWLWSDAVQVAYDAAQQDGDEPQTVRTARAVLGTADHKRFIKGGGKSSQIVLAIEMMRQRITEADDDAEPDPKDPQS